MRVIRRPSRLSGGGWRCCGVGVGGGPEEAGRLEKEEGGGSGNGGGFIGEEGGKEGKTE